MSTTLTATVAINAAFLQEIKEDNRELHQLLHQANELLSRPRRTVRPKLVVDLLSLHQRRHQDKNQDKIIFVIAQVHFPLRFIPNH